MIGKLSFYVCSDVRWAILLTILWGVVLSVCFGDRQVHGQQESTTPQSLNKTALVQSLNLVLDALEKKDFETASQFFVLPKNFRPEMLEGLLPKREISREGIRLLKQNASFSKATEAFGAERAAYFAEKSEVDVTQCYGFNHQTPSATAEVIGWWNGKQFNLIRLDDVGKLEPAADGELDMKAADESIDASLRMLKSAVEANPNDVTARGKFAMALYQAGQHSAAWSQLLAGNRIKPDHAGINKGLGVMVGVFESQGQLQVGLPADNIRQVLGEPRQELDLKTRQRWVYGYFGIDFKTGQVHEVIDLRGVQKALFEPSEIVSVELDGRGWVCRMRKKKAGSSAATYYLPDQSVADWTEQFEVERIVEGAKAGSMQEIGQVLVGQKSARHPGVVHRVIELAEDSITVEIEFPPESEMRYQLIRLLRGSKDVHRIAHTVRKIQLPADVQKRWLKIFASASLSPVDDQP